MATKPTVSLSRWADTVSANVTNPPSGSRDTGFVYGDPADEGVMNALLKQLYLWALYLNDGALTGDHTMSGTLGVTGLITATSGITAAAGQHVTVSGTGDFKHGDRVLVIPGAAGVGANVTYSATNGGVTSTAGTTIIFSVPLRQGDMVTSVTFSRSGDGAVDFTAIDFVISNTNSDTNVSLGSTTVTDVGALADTTINLTDTTIAADESAFMVFTVNAANAVIRNVRVTYNRP